MVEFGKISKASLKKLEIEKDVFYANFDWDLIMKAIRTNKIVYKEVSKFPSVRRDLSMLIDSSVTFDQLRLIAEQLKQSQLKDINVFDVYEGKNLPAGKKSYALSFNFLDEEKTMTDKQIDAIMQKLIINLEKEAGAEIRK